MRLKLYLHQLSKRELCRQISDGVIFGSGWGWGVVMRCEQVIQSWCSNLLLSCYHDNDHHHHHGVTTDQFILPVFPRYTAPSTDKSIIALVWRYCRVFYDVVALRTWLIRGWRTLWPATPQLLHSLVIAECHLLGVFMCATNPSLVHLVGVWLQGNCVLPRRLSSNWPLILQMIGRWLFGLREH